MERWLERNGPLAVVALAVLGGLIGVYDRTLAFHDEILNTSKAARLVVVDYAMRPVAYGLNALALRIFGDHTYALVSLSLVSLAVTTLVLYYICARYFSPAIGLLCAVSFVAVDMVRNFGVRAMPHMHAAMFMVLSLYFAIACFSEEEPRRQRILAFAAGVLAIVSFSTHPTMAGYLVGLCTWAATTWLLSLFRVTRSSRLACQMRPALWIAIGMAFSLACLMVIYALWFSQSYFGAWISFAKLPQGDEAEREISLYYVRYLVGSSVAALVVLGCSLLLVAFLRIRNRGPLDTSQESRARAFALAMPLYCLVVGAAMVSLNQWKHPRLLVSYLPLVSLSFACWFAAACSALSARVPRRFSRTLIAAVVAVMGMVAVRGLVRAAIEDKQSRAAVRQDYLSLYEALLNINEPRIGILAGPGGLASKVQYFNAAGLEWIRLRPTNLLAKAKNAAALEQELLRHQLRFVYWDLGSTSPQEYQEIAAELRSIGAGISFKWREGRMHGRRGELWFVQYTSTAFDAAFATLPAGTKVGVFGEDTELSPGTDFVLAMQLQAHQLRPYRLKVEKRTAARQLYYLTRNEVEYLMLPSRADHLIGQDQISAMEALLMEVGAIKVAEAGTPSLQLWHLADLQRASAAAEL